eukprot:5106169-Amphidinium_carterae.2
MIAICEAVASWPRLQKQGKLKWAAYNGHSAELEVDWKRWADSDEEDEKGGGHCLRVMWKGPSELADGGFDVDDMEGLDFSNVPPDDELESDDGILPPL